MNPEDVTTILLAVFVLMVVVHRMTKRQHGGKEMKFITVEKWFKIFKRYYHVALVYTKPFRINFYIDGKEIF